MAAESCSASGTSIAKRGAAFPAAHGYGGLAFPLAPTVSVRREIGQLRDAPDSTPWPRFELASVLGPGESRGGAFQGAAYGGDEADKSKGDHPHVTSMSSQWPARSRASSRTRLRASW